MDDLFRLAEREGIVVEYWDFTPPLEAVYWWSPGLPPVIGLAYSLERQPRAYQRCVLAEELGHHFTAIADAIPRTFFHYQDRLNVSRAEYRALRWAAEYLMPSGELKAALRKGIKESWELATWFDVTKEMAVFRLRLPDLRQS
ncbi:MAG: ImmA/IrrE family metallo-endopeptidase [Bacillota bacterium]